LAKISPYYWPRLWLLLNRPFRRLAGANDSVAAGDRQHVPLDEFAANLRQLVAIVQENTAANPTPCRIIIVGPPPICDAQHRVFALEKWGIEASRTNANTTRYAQCAVDVGRELGIPVLDLLPAILAVSADNGREYLSDGLHLSPLGQKFVYENLLSIIAEHFPELVVTPCPNTGQNANSSSSSQLPPCLPYHDSLPAGAGWETVFEGQ